MATFKNHLSANHKFILRTVQQKLKNGNTLASATNAADRTTSSVVTPNIRRGSKTPCFLKISQAIGTVELTGFVMIATKAFGQFFAAASLKSRTTLALVLNRSSRVIPGSNGFPLFI